jgi:hypothetical protein
VLQCLCICVFYLLGFRRSIQGDFVRKVNTLVGDSIGHCEKKIV